MRSTVTSLRGGRIVRVATLAILAGALVSASLGAKEYTSNFPFERCSWANKGDNDYWSLRPGWQLVLEGEEDGEEVKVQIRVLDKTQPISFTTQDGKTISLEARVIREKEWEGDEVIEISRNFFARCRQTGAIYYFGEEVDIYEDGEIVGHEGAWEAGVNGAMPGLVMPATFLLGSRYMQEVAPGVAMDRAKNIGVDLEIITPAGTFSGCVRVRETSPLDAGIQSLKEYCPGIGLVFDDPVELVSYGMTN